MYTQYVNHILKIFLPYFSKSIGFCKVTNDQYDSDSDNKDPIYQSIIKELNGKYYQKAESLCKEYLKLFSEDYSVRCVLAYIYRCLNNYEQAYLYLKEAIKLKPKEPIAYFIYGDIFFWQSEYDKAIDNLNISLEYKVKSIINLHIILGNCFFRKFHYDNALKNYSIALENILDKLLNINDKDSLILCYYGEILKNLGKYGEAVTYFTKANSIDPENIHNLNKRSIAYFVLQEYDKALLDVDKVVQFDSSNNLAHYNKGLIYYSIGNIENAIAFFKKCVELDFNDNLSKIQLYYMKYLQDSSEDLKHDIITEIDQILDDKSMSLIGYKIYIDLSIMDSKEYFIKFELFLLRNNDDISIFSLFQTKKYSNFWTNYLSFLKWNDDDLTELGIVDPFSKFLYKRIGVYFISNFINLNNEFHQFQVNDTTSLSGQILSSEGEAFSFNLPELCIHWQHYVIWKINVKKILSKDCSIKFIIKRVNMQDEHVLKFEDVSKLEGLGWIEYSFKISVIQMSISMQPSVVVNGLNMQVDYIRFIYGESRKDKQIYFPKMGHLLPIHKICPNVPEAFKDKYFPWKEMENLLTLKDIIDNL
ncbi:TPR-like protein [Rhizophagus irregularis]|uniref:TPR-like protein n=1 Tax=Rhizophagus irregularis TaxID=588596 RepID=A0A2I1H3Y6_9GLOM|nr:TPR-like protein [Rhizophagus irregularis]